MLDILRFSKCQFGVTAGNRRKRGVAYGWGRNSTFRPASPVRKGIARRYSKKMGVSASNRVSVDWYDNFLNTEAVFAHLPFASKDVNWRHAAQRRNLTAINHAAVRPVEPVVRRGRKNCTVCGECCGNIQWIYSAPIPSVTPSSEPASRKASRNLSLSFSRMSTGSSHDDALPKKTAWRSLIVGRIRAYSEPI